MQMKQKILIFRCAFMHSIHTKKILLHSRSLYSVLELGKHLWRDGIRIAIIFDRKQSEEQKKKIITSADVRLSVQTQVKSK